MTSLVPLDVCLAQATQNLMPVPPERLGLAEAIGFVLAADIVLPRDLPAQSQALRAGVAVAALDVMGASPQLPLPISRALRVQPGQAMPLGTDAVLPDDGVDWSAPLPHAVCPINPGEAIRRAGHDGRAGQILALAGDRFGPKFAFLAAEAGIESVLVRRPRVQIALENSAQADFIARWVVRFGAIITTEAPHIFLRAGQDHAPRIALCPGETAWLHSNDGVVVLDVPPRFDGMIAAFLVLCLPVLRALTGVTHGFSTRPLLRKAVSAPGVSDLVLLAPHAGGWNPMAPGTITLTALAEARAFAILPPETEGLPAGALLAAQFLDPDLNADAS